jgi:hypothetical protein
MFGTGCVIGDAFTKAWPVFESECLPDIVDKVESRFNELGIEVLYSRHGQDKHADYYSLRFVFTGHLLAVCHFNWSKDPLAAVWRMGHINIGDNAYPEVECYEVTQEMGAWHYRTKGFEDFCKMVEKHFRHDIVKYHLEKDGSVAG